MKYTKVIFILLFFTVAFPQNLMTKGINKLKEIEDKIRDEGAKLDISTPSTFNGERKDFKKVFALQRGRGKETSFLGIKGFQQTEFWASFGTIGENVEVVNMKMGDYRKIKDKSTFMTKTVGRLYQFDVSVDGESSNCICESKTSKTVYYPILLKERNMIFKFIRNLTSKTFDYLECEITNSAGEKSKLVMEYSEYKEKFGLKKKIASKMLPEDWRDNGLRFNLEGTLTYSDQTYNVSSTYDYGVSEDSPLDLIKPPVGYFLSNENEEYMMVKDPTKFRVSASLNDKGDLGTYYCALLASYFYYPQHRTFNSHPKNKIHFDHRDMRRQDFFESAKNRGPLGLF